MKRSTDNILQELVREQAKLSELERSRDEVRAGIESLRSELASGLATTPFMSPPGVAAKCDVPNTPSGKVRLFRSLFRGRTDIFPTRFVSRKTGNPGYAPACSNKFETGLCSTSKSPRLLTPCEIDLLRQDLQMALKLLGQDEIDDAHAVMRDQGSSSSICRGAHSAGKRIRLKPSHSRWQFHTPRGVAN